MRRLVRIDGHIWIILALSLFAWAPLWGPTYFLEAHDAPHSIFFLNDFDQAIRDGAFCPRWATDFALGYGYPLFILYSPLAFYVAEAFHLLGASLTASVKITYLLAFLLSGLSMYALAKRTMGRGAGLLAALAYIYIPYHLVDIYVRSAFAEFCALGFLPLILLFFHRLLETQERRYLAWAALAYAGLILTHAPTAFIFTPLLVAYILFRLFSIVRGSGRRLLPLGMLAAGGMALALGLSAIFLLPMLVEKGYVVEEQWISGSYSYDKHFVYFSQLFSPFWGYGYAGEGLADQMSFQLGAVAIILALTGLTFGWAGPRRGLLGFFAAATLALLLMMTPLAAPLWRLLPLAALIQFPWRLLSLVAFTLAFLTGGVALALEEEGFGPALAVLALLLVVSSYGYSTPQHTEPSPRSEEPVAIIDFETFHPPDRVGMTIWVEEQPQTSPLVPQYLAGEPLMKAHVLAQGGTVEMVRHGGASEEIVVRSPQETEVQFYTYYFPGWTAYVDGRKASIYPSGPQGLITLRMPAGEHRVFLRFEDTPIRTAGSIISFVSLLTIFGVLARKPFSAIIGFVGRGSSADGR